LEINCRDFKVPEEQFDAGLGELHVRTRENYSSRPNLLHQAGQPHLPPNQEHRLPSPNKLLLN
jgi:hypothetical protein